MTTASLDKLFDPKAFTCATLHEASTDITWQQAMDWTKRFRDTYGNTQAVEDTLIKGYDMSDTHIRTLLTQDGKALKGLKIYLGVDDRNVFRLIIVAELDQNGNDYKVPSQRPPAGTTVNAEEYCLIGEVRPCPDWCGGDNVLNSDN